LVRLAGFLARKHRRPRGFGWSVIAFQSPNYLRPWSQRNDHVRVLVDEHSGDQLVVC
jgi:hypothetical protein